MRTKDYRQRTTVNGERGTGDKSVRSEELGVSNTQIPFIPSLVILLPDLGIFYTSGGTFRTRPWYEILKFVIYSEKS